LSEEKRRTERIWLEAPVELPTGSGVSRNISESGIYFLTNQDLTEGSVVRFTVQFNFACPGKPLRLDCRGQVLRVEKTGDQFGVAASLGECWYVN
jgi:hypothetical protein